MLNISVRPYILRQHFLKCFRDDVSQKIFQHPHLLQPQSFQEKDPFHQNQIMFRISGEICFKAITVIASAPVLQKEGRHVIAWMEILWNSAYYQ